MHDSVIKIFEAVVGDFNVRRLSILGGIIQLKDAISTGPYRTIEARLVLLWIVAFSLTYTDAKGHHLNVEARVLCFSIDATLNLYPSFLP
jgi:hypothetical protein